jgi:hypothetical protein
MLLASLPSSRNPAWTRLDELCRRRLAAEARPRHESKPSGCIASGGQKPRAGATVRVMPPTHDRHDVEYSTYYPYLPYRRMNT